MQTACASAGLFDAASAPARPMQGARNWLHWSEVRALPPTLPTRLGSPGALELWTHRGLGVLFLAGWAFVLLRQLPIPWVLPEARWPEAALLVSTMLITVSGLGLRISLQSATMAAGAVGLIGGMGHWASYVSGVPFGPLHFPYAFGKSPFQEWFLVPTLLWIVMLLNARGLARLILEGRPVRRNVGIFVLVLSAVLVLTMAMALEPFASTVHRYWLWGDTRLPVTWQGVPLSCLFAWVVMSVIASFAATPFLLDKHPRPPPPPLEPAWIWALLSALFAVGTGVDHLWPAAIVAILNGTMAVAVAVVAYRRESRGRPVAVGRMT